LSRRWGGVVLAGSMAAIAAMCATAPAHACSRPPPFENLSCGPPSEKSGDTHSSVAGARLRLAVIEVQRRRSAPSEDAPCIRGDRLGLRLRVGLEGFEEWPEDVALRVIRTEGLSPQSTNETRPLWLMPSKDGVVALWGSDEPARPIDATLVVDATDCAGDSSLPAETHVADPGWRAEPSVDAGGVPVFDAVDAGGGRTASFESDSQGSAQARGCSMASTPARGRQQCLWAGLFVVALISRARRLRLQ